MGEKMDYVIGIDGPNADMAKTWMEAAGQNGIPAAFVVNGDGLIVWIGHPMNLDGVLEKVVAGSWDLETAKQHAKSEQEANELLGKLYQELQDVVEDEVKSLEFANKLDKLIEEKPSLMKQLAALKFESLVTKHPEKAMEAARMFFKGELRDDVDFLMTVSMGILEREDPKMDYALALEMARRFVDSVGADSPFSLDVLAMAHYRNRNYVEAILIGEKAVSLIDADIQAAADSGKEVPRGFTQVRQFLSDRVELYKKRGKG
jgi:hypothetical protein